MRNEPLKAAILEAQVEAALGGHQLAPFEEVENGYQAICTACGGSIWVGKQGLRYSLLTEECRRVKDKNP